MKIWVLAVLQSRMDVLVRGVLSLPLAINEPQVPLQGIVRVQVLYVSGFPNSKFSRCGDEVFLSPGAAISSTGDMNRAFSSVCLVLSFAVIRFKLDALGKYIARRKSEKLRVYRTESR